MPESQFERHQREAAERALRAAMPNIQRLMREVAKSHSDSPRIISEQYTGRYAEMIKSLTRDVSKFKLPTLAIDYKTLFPDFAPLARHALEQLTPALKAIQIVQREQFADVISKVRAAMQAALPPNWRGDDVTLPTNLEALLLDEGLPLAWLPPKSILIRLFAAKDAGARRRIIGRNWQPIARAAIHQLDTIGDDALAPHVEFAKEAANALLTGQPSASQALSANLLDSILRAEFDDGDRRTVTGRAQRLNIDEYHLRVAIVLGGIWGAHGEYWPDKGDVIPRNFSRHASAHAVSRRQYSRINAVLALMHVVALLRVLEIDLKVPDQ